ncbi:glycosyl hydrolase [Aspergillus pseudoustus]|uniref:Glycosyl hydrolase n=1 Tax=Aspergillus pseudoustus TaxID=1810923 RepID=A0ABR4JYE7_9EURO
MPPPSTFTNPILWEDLPDPEVIRVGEKYYMSASSFHFSPGAPVLESTDLVHWGYIGHSLPALPEHDARFSLNTAGKRPAMAYGKGVWASTLKYRESNGLFYFYSPLQGTDKTCVFTAADPAGPWTERPAIERFYYDLGLLVDDGDDEMYIAHGTKTIEVAKLGKDGFSEVTSKVVHASDSYLEGARMYKIKGTYYIWLTKDWDTQTVLKSTVGPFGPYEERDVIRGMRTPIAGCGSPHQGALVDTSDGKWYYMAFADAYPAGRIPVLAPVVFDEDGWPSVVADYAEGDEKGVWRLEYPVVGVGAATGGGGGGGEGPAKSAKRFEFTGSQLDHVWEWNHNPDNSKWRLEDGQLVLEPATVTESLHLATNTLTLRTTGPGSIATFCIDTSKMRDGDRAGVSMFRDESAYIGIHHHKGGSGNASLVYVDGAKVAPVGIPVGWLNGRPAALDWECVSDGELRAEVPLKENQVWLRVKVDVRGAFVGKTQTADRKASFEYSYDGEGFEQLGPVYTLTQSMAGYIGYRFALFNFATKALGGEIRVRHCDFETWEPTG